MREREAATKYRNASLHGGEDSLDQEKQKSALLVSADLPELAFYALIMQGSRGQACDLICLNPGAQAAHPMSSELPCGKGV